MSTWHVYKYICGCGHWWATTSEDRHCPKCGGDELVSRVYLESEEAAMLTALGAVTAERDEALDLLREALPGAMWTSCGYQDHEMSNPLFHCCEWTDWAERAAKAVGIELDLEFEAVPGKMHHEFVKEVEIERDDARRWARHFYRLWKATQRSVASKGRKPKGAK